MRPLRLHQCRCNVGGYETAKPSQCSQVHWPRSHSEANGAMWERWISCATCSLTTTDFSARPWRLVSVHVFLALPPFKICPMGCTTLKHAKEKMVRRTSVRLRKWWNFSKARARESSVGATHDFLAPDKTAFTKAVFCFIRFPLGSSLLSWNRQNGNMVKRNS